MAANTALKIHGFCLPVLKDRRATVPAPSEGLPGPRSVDLFRFSVNDYARQTVALILDGRLPELFREYLQVKVGRIVRHAYEAYLKDGGSACAVEISKWRKSGWLEWNGEWFELTDEGVLHCAHALEEEKRRRR